MILCSKGSKRRTRSRKDFVRACSGACRQHARHQDGPRSAAGMAAQVSRPLAPQPGSARGKHPLQRLGKRRQLEPQLSLQLGAVHGNVLGSGAVSRHRGCRAGQHERGIVATDLHGGRAGEAGRWEVPAGVARCARRALLGGAPSLARPRDRLAPRGRAGARGAGVQAGGRPAGRRDGRPCAAGAGACSRLPGSGPEARPVDHSGSQCKSGLESSLQIGLASTHSQAAPGPQ